MTYYRIDEKNIWKSISSDYARNGYSDPDELITRPIIKKEYFDRLDKFNKDIVDKLFIRIDFRIMFFNGWNQSYMFFSKEYLRTEYGLTMLLTFCFLSVHVAFSIDSLLKVVKYMCYDNDTVENSNKFIVLCDDISTVIKGCIDDSDSKGLDLFLAVNGFM